MSDQPPTKKTLAQVRAEKEERNHELRLGIQHSTNLLKAYDLLGFQSKRLLGQVHFGEWNALMSQVNRAYEILKNHPDHQSYWHVLLVKGRIHHELGQLTLALASFQQFDEACIAADRKGLLKAEDQVLNFPCGVD